MGILIASFFFIVSVTLLVFTRLGVLNKGRILFKISSSILFLVLWLVSITGKNPNTFDYLILASLIFYMTGDTLLALFRTKKGFLTGMAAFATGNIIMIINLILFVGIGVWDLPVLIMLLIVAAFGLKIGRLDFEGVGIIIAVYIGIICVMVAKALSIIWSSAGVSIVVFLFAIGALLYGVSDIVLANNKFKYKDNRWLSPLNLSLYYSGIGLIAIFSSMIP